MNADDAKLDIIIALLRQLVAAVEHPTPEPASNGLSRDDHAVLSTLLPAISDAIGDLVFSTADLADEAESDDDLRAALTGLNGRQLGRLFARCNVEIVDHRVERAGSARDGALWRVRRGCRRSMAQRLGPGACPR